MTPEQQAAVDKAIAEVAAEVDTPEFQERYTDALVDLLLTGKTEIGDFTLHRDGRWGLTNRD